ncbi:hypothetical protein [Alteribacillus iranensis]|uniref:Uncharacterized protein n=1 Tax=Alteribacillus iranensis TaxID=930128 RepID=A0A1I2F439_9BACI|nr:hypothetical protein [Alteribacillus iranensis]SFE99291.1 hypothetical protein SAMN05192532_10857 [Alteribacillus iranensis]
MAKPRRAIVKKKEMRTKEISTMIAEGGLGAERYYDIKKRTSSSKNRKLSKNNKKNG